MKTFVLRFGLLLTGLCMLLATQGCETMGGGRVREDMRQREDMLMVQDDFLRMEGRLEGLEVELARLEKAVESMRGAHARETTAQLQLLQARLDELESRITRVDAARERDKKELVDRLGNQIAEIMAKSRPAATGTRRTDRRLSGTGYEHEVKAGQSLSAIASAYGVTVQAILDHNDIKDPHMIRVGQKLFIPE